MSDRPQFEWSFRGEPVRGLWHSERGTPAPRKIVSVDDQLTADEAYRYACAGTYLLWEGDYHNARQLLSALGRRLEGKKKPAKDKSVSLPGGVELFNRHRMEQAQRASILHRVLVPVDEALQVPLRRAPDTRQVFETCLSIVEPAPPRLISLKELLGLLGAHQWMSKGIELPVLDGVLYPAYGVFSPVRGEYLDLFAQVPLPKSKAAKELTAFDIGTGTGVLAALLARRGVGKVLATEVDPRALACAKSNIENLGCGDSVQVVQQSMFPDGQADLVVCNPPWLPAKPSSPVEAAVYDSDSQMLKAFLSGLKNHLHKDGEGWLVLSDLAERIGLRTREQLLGWIEDGGLKVLEKLDTRPVHPKASKEDDPLHQFRKNEVTSLWRLGHA